MDNASESLRRIKLGKRIKRKSLTIIYDRRTFKFYLDSHTVSKVVGIERGIKNIAVLSNNMFFNAGQLRSIKGRYSNNRSELQRAGTRSARRKLKELSGRKTVRAEYKSCNFKRDRESFL
jgi:hypothetical protein